MLVSTGFQVLFHSPPGVLFTFPSQYCFAIGHQVVFRLGGWSPLIPTGFLVSRSTLAITCWIQISDTWLSHSLVSFPKLFSYLIQCMMLSQTPSELLPMVWPLSLSLATTQKISVDFFSSPYLDVSVQAVPLIQLWIHCMMHELLHADCSIRTSAAHSVLTAPRSFSQLTTSFFGSWCQGIHPALLFTLPYSGMNLSSQF